MTAQELITELEKLEDKDLDLYVNVHDRDLNASRNILKEGLKVLNKILNPRNVEDSGLTDHHTNSFTVSGDVLASESNTL